MGMLQMQQAQMQQAALVAYYQQLQQQALMAQLAPSTGAPAAAVGGAVAGGGGRVFPAPAIGSHQEGRLKKFVEDKGFGFIECDGGVGDVFVHERELKNGGQEDMVVGVRLSFDVELDDRAGKAKA